ncbi:LysR family transcriptional regulator [Zhengella mangrovi]|uniref:LysR family transcriptional regulator n=1 Tax=Zhengella mangrovi TaxID=1982044 RepID=A0A2G1QKV4_9HYPH|nr:LysR family transcriptional regulator [Zhengella mangrovi]PHP66156.1 LysR family transcriptional regulator [Zhengella mangrovi]
MDDFDWNLIKSFLAVAETGSLSAAARRLKASQPTLGRHVTELEDRLGVTLFERIPRGMILTDAGSALLDHARRIAADTAALSMTATGASQEVAGTVRIAASQIVAHLLLPDIVTALRRAEPGLQVEIVASNQIQNLLTRDADIAIRMTEPAQAELISKKIAVVAMGAFASPSYLENAPPLQAPEDLLHHAIVGYDRDDLIIQGFQAMGWKLTRDFFPVRTDDQVLHWRMVEAGAGIGFNQLYAGLQSPRVVRILPDLPLPPLHMHLAVHRELRTSLRIRRAYDFLAAALSALPLATGA